ncbi:MAG TPA: DUF2934 domain-containing protein [Burkholderiales bacterium]|nr:DUF2934 domain-containing protein [Burkholderiales bacterium]
MKKQPETKSAPKAPSEQEVRARIAIAAYYLAERRGFTPGMDLDNWLAAEAELKEKAWTSNS